AAAGIDAKDLRLVDAPFFIVGRVGLRPQQAGGGRLRHAVAARDGDAVAVVLLHLRHLVQVIEGGVGNGPVRAGVLAALHAVLGRHAPIAPVEVLLRHPGRGTAAGGDGDLRQVAIAHAAAVVDIRGRLHHVGGAGVVGGRPGAAGGRVVGAAPGA